jgi:hypothetical protein
LTRIADAAGRQHFDYGGLTYARQLRRIAVALLYWFACCVCNSIVVTGEESFTVSIQIDAALTVAPLVPIWCFFGADRLEVYGDSHFARNNRSRGSIIWIRDE